MCYITFISDSLGALLKTHVFLSGSFRYISVSKFLIHFLFVICSIRYGDRKGWNLYNNSCWYQLISYYTRCLVSNTKCYNTWLERYGIWRYGIGGYGTSFRYTFSFLPFAAFSPPRKFSIIDTILFWRPTVVPNSSRTSFSTMVSIYKCRERRTVESNYKDK